MQLLYSPSSPFVRKVILVAQSLGLEDRIERLPSAASPIKPDARITAHNPLGKVPTLIADDGTAVIDSKVIVDYLCSLAPNEAVLPAKGQRRWQMLRQQALADGILEAAVSARYENALRPAELRWNDWSAGQMGKVAGALEALQNESAAPAQEGPLNVGECAVAAALGYLDFRYADFDWRKRYPKLATAFSSVLTRPQVQASAPA